MPTNALSANLATRRPLDAARRPKIYYITMGPPRPARSGYTRRVDSIATALGALGDLRLLVMLYEPDPEAVAATSEAFDATFVAPPPASKWKRAARQMVAAATGRHRWWAAHFDLPSFASARAEATAFAPDLVIVGHPGLAGVDAALGFDASLTILDHPDPASLNFDRLMKSSGGLDRLRFYLDREMLRRVEKDCPNRLAQWAVSEHDRALVSDLTGVDAAVAPNVVEDRFFDEAPPTPPSGPPIFGFLGYYAYPPNAEAALEAIEISNMLAADGVAHRLELVGGGATDAMRAAADGAPQAEIVGFAKELEPIMRRWTMMLAPIRTGTGTKLKIIQSFAMGIPVATTSAGAEGMPLASSPEHAGAALAVVEDEPSALAASCMRLAADPASRNAMRDRARDWAWRNGSETHLRDRLEALIKDALATQDADRA